MSTTLTGKRILILDDDDRLSSTLRVHFERLGMEVLTEASGPAGYEALERAMPDLLLVDNALPGRLGYQVVEMARRLPGGAELPVLLMSAFDGTLGVDRGNPVPIDGFLAKPFSLHDLTRRVEALVRRDSEAMRTREQRVDAWMRGGLQVPDPDDLPNPPREDLAQVLRAELELARLNMQRHGVALEANRFAQPPPPSLSGSGVQPESPSPATAPHGNARREHTPAPAGGLSFGLAETPPVTVLARLMARYASGVARMRGPTGGFTAVVREGIPSYIETSSIDRSFGAFLHQSGIIGDESFQEFSQRWRRGRRPPPARFIQHDGIAPQQLLELLADYIELRMTEFLGWDDGTCSFKPDPAVMERWPAVDFDPFRMVFRWIEANWDIGTLAQAMEPSYPRVVKFEALKGQQAEFLRRLLAPGRIRPPVPAPMRVAEFLQAFDLGRGLLVLQTLLTLEKVHFL